MAISPLTQVGKAGVLDKQGMEIITGKWEFAQDILPGQKLFTGIKQCPYAHAKIKSVDTSEAEKMTGVKAVITYKDVDPPVMEAEVKFWGMPVAAVAATDPWLAQAAAEAIKVEYDVLPFVVDPDEAMKSGAPAVVAGKTPNFTTSTIQQEKGSLDAGFKASDVVVEDTVGWTSMYSHNTPETRSATCWWVGDHLWVWIGSQNVHNMKQNLANELHIPHAQVHLRSHGTGGAYGDKKPYCEEAQIAAALAKKAGMAVNCQYSRAVNAIGATHQYAAKQYLKVGCTKDGTIQAIDAIYYADGAYASSSSASGSANTLRMTYKTPNIRVVGTSTATNRPRTGPFRSVGELHGTFLMETTMDAVAEKLGMDPVDFRLKNVWTPEVLDGITNRPLSSCVMKEVIQDAADRFQWKQKWHAPGAKTLPDGRMHGVGFACSVCEKGGYNGNQFTATVQVNVDGTAVCNYGIARASTGTNTALDHVVAEALGLDIANVYTGEIGNSDVTGYGGNQAGSRATSSNAPAAYLAAIDALDQLKANAAKTLKTTADQLDAKDGKIFLKSDPTKFVKHGDATGGVPIAGKGKNWPDNLQKPVLNWAVGTPATSRTFVAAAVEIAVDTETGQFEVLDWVETGAFGRIAFRHGAESTINATMEMQFSIASYWEQLYDPTTGGTLTADYLTQRIATALDLPTDKMRPGFYEHEDAMTCYSIKGMGEPPINPYVAITNAFHNATGKWIKQSPMYPSRALAALGKA